MLEYFGEEDLFFDLGETEAGMGPSLIMTVAGWRPWLPLPPCSGLPGGPHRELPGQSFFFSHLNDNLNLFASVKKVYTADMFQPGFVPV